MNQNKLFYIVDHEAGKMYKVRAPNAREAFIKHIRRWEVDEADLQGSLEELTETFVGEIYSEDNVEEVL